MQTFSRFDFNTLYAPRKHWLYTYTHINIHTHIHIYTQTNTQHEQNKQFYASTHKTEEPDGLGLSIPLPPALLRPKFLHSQKPVKILRPRNAVVLCVLKGLKIAKYKKKHFKSSLKNTLEMMVAFIFIKRKLKLCFLTMQYKNFIFSLYTVPFIHNNISSSQIHYLQV